MSCKWKEACKKILGFEKWTNDDGWPKSEHWLIGFNACLERDQSIITDSTDTDILTEGDGE